MVFRTLKVLFRVIIIFSLVGIFILFSLTIGFWFNPIEFNINNGGSTHIVEISRAKLFLAEIQNVQQMPAECRTMYYGTLTGTLLLPPLDMIFEMIERVGGINLGSDISQQGGIDLPERISEWPGAYRMLIDRFLEGWASALIAIQGDPGDPCWTPYSLSEVIQFPIQEY